MKKRWKEAALLVMGTLGFWGMVYPDYCFTQETCRIVQEDGTVFDRGQSGGDLFWELYDADPENVRFKSRLAEIFSGTED